MSADCNMVELYNSSQPSADLGYILCDYCIENSTPAAKTCLKCEASLCAFHLQPHLLKPPFNGHILIEPVADLTSRQCPDHKKLFQFYCEDDAISLCSACIILGRHRSHTLQSLEQTQASIQKELQAEVEKLQGIQQNCSSKQRDLERHEAETQTQINELKGGLQKIFCKWRRRLEEGETSTLSLIDKEGLRILSKIRSCSNALKKRMDLITSLDRENQNLVQKDPVFFIQNSKQLLSRLSETQRHTVPDLPVIALNLSNISEHLQKKLNGWEKYHSDLLGIIMPASTEHMDTSNVSPFAPSNSWKAPVTGNDLQTSTQLCRIAGISQGKTSLSLDPKTANFKLILSHDLRSVTWTEQQQPYPPHPERFNHHPQVLCSQSFSSGSHSWDVETAGNNWGIGIVCGNAIRQGLNAYLGNSNKSWCLTFYAGTFLRACHNNKPIFLQKFPLNSRVRVQLDYEAGTVSFHQITESLTHLHTIQTTFTEPVFPAFCCWKSSLKLIY
ncbi:E3 ubiquitin/ISG15 ligase TRIM25-like [Chiloscyllium plagiosum]|uniref:E3 ubiquitin/ISG15 ligase TRIM25-like n=1 Tax=Chiloscyllium plagiosum TaxID=36176 RepID=UPI001CB7E031|nr:E3 ubiquitin/ISG15 ligase TRIM25-like [Chiloscyllium plagiosum]